MMAMPHALLESSSPASMLSLEKREGCFPRPLHSTTLHLWRLPLGKPWLSCCCPVRLAPHSPEANDPCQCAALAATPLFLDGLVPSLGFELCFLPRVAIVRRERWGEEGGKPQSRQEHTRTAASGSGKTCACRGREENPNSTSSPVSQFRPFICHPHLMIRQAHLIAHRTRPAHLAEPPRMPRCPLLPSLNGNESSTRQALSLVRRSLPLPVVGFLFS